VWALCYEDLFIFGQGARDDKALDFAGALVDLGDFGVAHEALHVVLFHVAVAAVNLDGFGGDPHRSTGGIKFGHSGKGIVVEMLIFGPGGFEAQ